MSDKSKARIYITGNEADPDKVYIFMDTLLKGLDINRIEIAGCFKRGVEITTRNYCEDNSIEHTVVENTLWNDRFNSFLNERIDDKTIVKFINICRDKRSESIYGCENINVNTLSVVRLESKRISDLIEREDKKRLDKRNREDVVDDPISYWGNKGYSVYNSSERVKRVYDRIEGIYEKMNSVLEAKKELEPENARQKKIMEESERIQGKSHKYNSITEEELASHLKEIYQSTYYYEPGDINNQGR